MTEKNHPTIYKRVFILPLLCLCFMALFLGKFESIDSYRALISTNIYNQALRFSPDPDEIVNWKLVPAGRKFRWDKSVVAVRGAYFHPTEARVLVTCHSAVPELQNKGKWPYKHFCYFYDSNKELVDIVPGNFSTGYLFRCANSSTMTVPAYLYMNRNDTPGTNITEKPPWLISVANLDARRKSQNTSSQRGQMAICLKTLSQSFSWMLFVQFVEYYRLHGVTKFYIPLKMPLSPFSRKLLSYYYRIGLVDVDYWGGNLPNCKKDDIKCSQMVDKAECILKTAYFYKYVLFCDFDELLQPVNHNFTLLDFIRMKDSPNIGSFIFAARYHLTESKEPVIFYPTSFKEITKPYLYENLPMIKWNNVSGPVNINYSPKSVVKPETVKKMWVHFVKEFYPTYRSLDINPTTEGFFHHFKNRWLWGNNVRQTYSAGYKVEKSESYFNESLVDRVINGIHFTMHQVF